MKTLTKIRLINWHYFFNETISLKGNTLMTGENASGKSTILDAISYVLTAGDQNFNLAANEKSKRDLRSYVKCKLGSLDQDYLRDYDQSAHICLEFYSEKQNKSFCLGTIIDVIGNVQPVKSTFYIVDGPMDESFFVTGEQIKSSSDFKKANITQYVFTTRKEAKSAFRAKMGGVSDKYFTLLPKALAFKPISDVKDYIYQHLLEEKQINVQNIQDSIRSYKEFETILKQTRSKINDLDNIISKYNSIKELRDTKDFDDYLLKDLKRSDNDIKVDSISRQIEKIEREINDVNDSIKSYDYKIDSEDERSKELYAALSKDESFRSEELYDKDIKRVEGLYKLAFEKKKEFERRTLEFKENASTLELVDKELAKEFSKLPLNANDLEGTKTLINKLEEVKNILNKKNEDFLRKETELNISKNSLVAKISNVYKSLNQLSQNSIPYRPEIIELRNKMEEHLKDLYFENISVHILAEIIDVKDPSWQNTIEDFLANQRFTLIVEPKYYDDCLDVYNEYKSKKIYGINLLNTKKIQEFTSYSENSLASIIETDNKDARCYINYFCGQLIMVDDVHDLDKYPQSITKSGMLYRGFSTRYLNPNTEKPFIGKNAREAQNKKFVLEGETLKQQFNSVSESLNKIKEAKEIVEKLNITYFLELANEAKDSYLYEAELNELKDKKKHLSLTGVNDLRLEYENLNVNIRKLKQEKDTLQLTLGAKKQAIEQFNSDIININIDSKTIELELANIEKEHIDYKTRCENLFNELRESGETTRTIEDKYTKEINELNSSLKTMEPALTVVQVNYISKYNRPFNTGFDHIEEYLEEQDKLVKSELIKYENKVRESREEAEKLFKEDFLSKLRSYILEAQDEMSKINETLDKIVFGKEKYQFIFPKSKEFSAIYDMIVNEIGNDPYSTIFNEEFEKKYNQELDELFNNLAMDEEGSQGNLNKYTDYRTYMDYDIKIISGDDEFYFSSINKLRSGAETQIPFYVAILASFVRLFDKAEKSGIDDSIGLILFDEVFDKMDPTRIDAMMDFIGDLNVQIIFAGPTQKIETLSKKTQTTVAVVNKNRYAGTFVAQAK